MTNYYFAEHLLLRAPVRQWQEYFLAEQAHLDNALLRGGIYLASPQFYSVLKEHDFIYERLSNREKLTLRKYINRSCFRSIPFGLFAGVSMMRWRNYHQIDLPETFQPALRLFPDQAWTTVVAADIQQRFPAKNCQYETNPSLYKLANEYRFISSEPTADGNARKYLLQSVDFTLILKELADYCRTARSSSEIIEKICAIANCSELISEDYFQFLKGEQFLLNSDRPTITGKGHLDSIINRFKNIFPTDSIVAKLETCLSDIALNSSFEAEQFATLTQELARLTPNSKQLASDSQLYGITTFPDRKTDVPMQYQERILDALTALEYLTEQSANPFIAQFVERFQRNFDGQTLDLLYALDPEVGIGYYNEASPSNQLIETLPFATPEADEKQAVWTNSHSLLLEKWHGKEFQETSVINLTLDDLETLKAPSRDYSTSGLSVLFRVAGDHVLVESAGGVNPLALLGRFTIAGEAFRDAARTMAMAVEQQNPDVIFAELLHLSGTHTDNINRRETVWSYEIPITAASTLPPAQQIQLDELRVKIDQGKVVLFSEKHRKIVLPLLTSAYNHTIDKLPLFRFLVDISFQYGQSGLALDLRDFFPDLSYYPRVVYKQSILALATWVWNELQVNERYGTLINAEGKDGKHILTAFGLPPVFSLTEGDQQLVFFRDRAGDAQFLAECIRNKKEVVIKEFLLSADQTSGGDSGPAFTDQFNAYLLPSGPLSLPAFEMSTTVESNVTRRLIPGSEWLYLKLYTSRTSSSKLLLKIAGLLRRPYGGRKIQSWFFIRYEDHAPHIRLRIQMTPEDISLLLIAFKKALENDISQHVIREYQIDVYERELERYSAAGISLTEIFFWRSSEMAIRYLKAEQQGGAQPAFAMSLRTTWDMVRLFIPDAYDRLTFLDGTAQQLLTEFKDNGLKVELDLKYRELRKTIHTVLSDGTFYRAHGMAMTAKHFFHALTEIAPSLSTETPQKEAYIQSIVHMHLNRLFVTEPRQQELVIYYLLSKYALSEVARSRNNSG